MQRSPHHIHIQSTLIFAHTRAQMDTATSRTISHLFSNCASWLLGVTLWTLCVENHTAMSLDLLAAGLTSLHEIAGDGNEHAEPSTEKVQWSDHWFIRWASSHELFWVYKNFDLETLSFMIWRSMTISEESTHSVDDRKIEDLQAESAHESHQRSWWPVPVPKPRGPTVPPERPRVVHRSQNQRLVWVLTGFVIILYFSCTSR